LALGNLPARPTSICVECHSGPTAYAAGGFLLHVSCIPGLRGFEDILALYTRAAIGPGVLHCSVHPEISGFIPTGGASGLQFTNDLRILAYGGSACVSGMMREVAVGADLHHIMFCVTVKGR
jgi:hypothetical protein